MAPLQCTLCGYRHNAHLPDLERAVSDFVEHYNHRRYHESLDNLVPAKNAPDTYKKLSTDLEAIRLVSGLVNGIASPSHGVEETMLKIAVDL